MWGLIIGGLLGAGAGYATYSYSRGQQDACFNKNLPADSADPTVAAEVSQACHTAHPVRSVLSDDKWLSMGSGLVLGGVIGHFAFRK